MPNSLFSGLLGPIFIEVLLLAALLKILKFTEKMSGDFGAMAAEYAGKVVGVAGTVGMGMATGGASVAMRGVGGGLAAKVANSGVMERMATSNSKVGQWVGHQGITLTDKAKTGTWDIRETGLGKATLGAGMKAVGMDMGAERYKSAAGGYVGAQERQQKEDLEFAKKLEVSDAEKRRKAAELDPNYEKAVESREGRRAEKVVAEKKELEAKAEVARNPTPASLQALADATNDLANINAQLKATEDVITKGNIAATKWAKEENARRKESYAQQVETRRPWKPSSADTGASSKQSRETTAEKVRKEGKDKQKLEREKEAIVNKFRADLGIPNDTRPIDDPALVTMIENKRDALEVLEANAESDAAGATAGTPAHKAALVAHKKATRNLKEFTDAHTKVKAIEKEIKEKENKA